jgi:hypothetical protein
MADDQPGTTRPTSASNGASGDPHPLAVAEEAAAKEARAEAERAAEATRIVRPRATTSRKAAPKPDSVAPAPAVSGEIVTAPEFASIRDGGAAEVNARNVDVTRGGIGRARATDIAVSQGGIGLAQGDRISVEMGGVGAALAGELRVTQGGVGSVLAREVHIEQSAVRSVIANEVHFERTTGVIFVLARRVEGDVKAILDWRGALAFGAAFGIVTSLFRRRK